MGRAESGAFILESTTGAVELIGHRPWQFQSDFVGLWWLHGAGVGSEHLPRPLGGPVEVEFLRTQLYAAFGSLMRSG
jgi:hypothetical protein